MGIFKKAKPVLPTEEELRAVEKAEEKLLAEEILKEKEDAQKLIWFKERTKTDFMEMFVYFDQQIRKASAYPDQLEAAERACYYRILDLLQSLKEAWFDIDKNLVSDEDAVLMTTLISEQLPKDISNFLRYVPTSGINCWWYVESPYDRDTIENNGWDKRPARLGLASRLGNLFVSIASIQDKQSVFSFPHAFKLDSAINSGSFPTFSTVDFEITEALLRLEKIWNQASTKENTIESEYFLEQVVISYIPEAWDLYKTFEFAPSETKKRAQDVLLQQFNLIETHILEILNTHLDRNIDAMETQLRFLEKKVAQPITHALEIEPRLQEITT